MSAATKHARASFPRTRGPLGDGRVFCLNDLSFSRRREPLGPRAGSFALYSRKFAVKLQPGQAPIRAIRVIRGFFQFRAIRWAMKPAPKPLSMLTTAIPGAQALSMASRAESPRKFAP